MVVGALSVVESHTCPCLCLDTLVSANMNHKTSGDLVLNRNLMTKRHLELGTSFVDLRFSAKALYRKKKRSKAKSMVIVNELAGQYEDSFEDVKTQILNYFTYKAVRTVLNQLYEMNPTQYRWFYDFLATNKPGDGTRFLRSLGKEKHELAERVMVTRLHLYAKWIKKCDHAAIYKEISDQNLELMRERLMETVIWPSDDTNTEKIG